MVEDSKNCAHATKLKKALGDERGNATGQTKLVMRAVEWCKEADTSFGVSKKILYNFFFLGGLGGLQINPKAQSSKMKSTQPFFALYPSMKTWLYILR